MSITITDITALNTAIEAADERVASGTVTITLDGTIALGDTQLEAINLHSGVTLDIAGGGATLEGGGTQGGLFVQGGAVTVSDLTIDQTSRKAATVATAHPAVAAAVAARVSAAACSWDRAPASRSMG